MQKLAIPREFQLYAATATEGNTVDPVFIHIEQTDLRRIAQAFYAAAVLADQEYIPLFTPHTSAIRIINGFVLKSNTFASNQGTVQNDSDFRG